MGAPKGHPRYGGRTTGSKNKRTVVAEEFAQSFLQDADFQDTIRAILGNAQHEHWQWTVELVTAYAFGKPIERKEMELDADVVSSIEVVDFRSAFEGPATNGATAPV